MGLIEAMLSSVENSAKEQIVKRISEKNSYELHSLCREYGVDEETDRNLRSWFLHTETIAKLSTG